MRIAITGHRGLPPETERLVGQAIREQLDAYPGRDLVGVSNLADGADQLFAQAVLDAGGQLDVIVPAARYRDGLPEFAHATYDALLSRASSVHRPGRIDSDEDAHMAASKAMLDRADRLFAVLGRQARPRIRWHRRRGSRSSGSENPGHSHLARRCQSRSAA